MDDLDFDLETGRPLESSAFRSALSLYMHYSRNVKVEPREKAALIASMRSAVEAGGNVTLVHTSNGLEFRINSKVKEVKPSRKKKG